MDDNGIMDHTNGIRDRSPFGDRDRDFKRERDDSMDRSRMSKRDRPSRFDRDRSSNRDRGSRRAPYRRVYVSNIPYEYRWQELKDLFRKEVGEVSFVEVFEDEGGKSRGCGIIEFDSPESVQNALDKMHRFELKGRKIVVKEDFGVQRDKFGRIIREGIGGGRGDMREDNRSMSSPTAPQQNKWGNTYGLSPAFLESLGIDGPLVSRVFVANLDYKVDEKNLEEVFRIAGKVVSVEINRDKDNKSRGHGVVEFEHPVEAVQAISMLNNQLYFERKLSVRMDRVSEKAEMQSSKLPQGLRGIGMGLGIGGKALQDVVRGGILNAGMTIGAGMPGIGSSGLGTTGLSNMGNMGLAGASNLGTSMTTGLGLSGVGMTPNMANTMSGMTGMSGITGVTDMSAMGGLGMAAGGLPTNLSNLSNLGSMGSNLATGLTTSRDYDHSSYYSTNAGLSVSNTNMNIKSDTVAVTNLPHNYTWHALRDKFRDIGEVRFAEIKQKGSGLVRFATEREAERAVNVMDRSRVEGRIIEVRPY